MTSRPVGADPLHVALSDLGQGRLAALEVIWKLIAADLFGLALWRTGTRWDAEEAVQEVFVRLARMVGRLPATSRPRAYLLTMAHRAAVDVVRRRRPAEPLETVAELLDPATDPSRSSDARSATSARSAVVAVSGGERELIAAIRALPASGRRAADRRLLEQVLKETAWNPS